MLPLSRQLRPRAASSPRRGHSRGIKATRPLQGHGRRLPPLGRRTAQEHGELLARRSRHQGRRDSHEVGQVEGRHHQPQACRGVCAAGRRGADSTSALLASSDRDLRPATSEGCEFSTSVASVEQSLTLFTTQGKIPRNNFGNIDLYVPSMLPEGAIHLSSEPDFASLPVSHLGDDS